MEQDMLPGLPARFGYDGMVQCVMHQWLTRDISNYAALGMRFATRPNGEPSP